MDAFLRAGDKRTRGSARSILVLRGSACHARLTPRVPIGFAAPRPARGQPASAAGRALARLVHEAGVEEVMRLRREQLQHASGGPGGRHGHAAGKSQPRAIELRSRFVNLHPPGLLKRRHLQTGRKRGGGDLLIPLAQRRMVEPHGLRQCPHDLPMRPAFPRINRGLVDRDVLVAPCAKHIEVFELRRRGQYNVGVAALVGRGR